MSDEEADPSAASIPEVYTRHAHLFDGKRSRSLGEGAWIDRFVAPIEPGSPVLDLGCGAGEPIAGHLLERGYAITGCDISPPLLALAQERFPDAKWVEGDMRTIDFEHRFDGIVAWHSFFHLPIADQRALISKFSAWLTSGGMLLFTSGTEKGETIGELGGEPLYHASLDTEGYRREIGRAGFEIIEHRVDDETCGGANIWLVRLAVGRARG